MDAIVMVGGRGGDLGIEDKPNLILLDKPIIGHVIDSLAGSENVDNIYVALSPFSLKTRETVLSRYSQDVDVIITPGMNYVADMIHAVKEAGISGPVLIIMYDIVMITPEVIDFIISEYQKCGKPSMSVHVPISIFRNSESRPETVFNRNGKLISPAGINIMLGKDIDQEQEDCNLVLHEMGLAFNLNTVYDLDRCEQIMVSRRC
ncbi:putative nucleotidyltransferase [Methanosalsum zhilinae DSM 4017]|uniref:Putative nucleotidyltransferase n=1 Tax=Methanosalsum zhilinae (strain DSM 4017 / NBRC 107636 / OCM 62 / WeN5) TaxID=679901 RepID=F7XNP6_METZD|nr:NTP transferase domain-containing protein [Methanosalsum zhilinae]AEH61247.1 putative nucleotidyltransferase [Methanosalsum zhilinae DSM 4017]